MTNCEKASPPTTAIPSGRRDSAPAPAPNAIGNVPTSAAIVVGLGLAKVPRAVLALHPVVALMGVCVVRIAYRMLYEHARSRSTGGSAELRRALVLGAHGFVLSAHTMVDDRVDEQDLDRAFTDLVERGLRP